MTTFVPTSITGCQLWLDAKDAASLTLSGSTLTTWNDKSGNLRNATKHQTVAPSYSATGLNSLPAIVMSTGQGLYAPMPAGTCSTAISVFAVFIKTGAANNFETIFNRTFSNGGYPIDLYNLNRNSGGNSTFNIQNATTATLFNVVVTHSNWSEWVNGTSIISNTNTSYSDTATKFFIGVRDDTATQFTGAVSEVLVYNVALTASDRQTIEGYLAWKWGLQSNLPVGHTYKAAAPVTGGYRYYKFEVVSIESNSTENVVQFAELLIGYNGTKLNYTGATSTALNVTEIYTQEPVKGIDGVVSTKWCALYTSANNPIFIVDFKTSKLVNCYTYITGNDSPWRDPKSFIFYGSNDNTTWVTMDTQTNFATSTTRNYQLPWINIQPPVNALGTDPIIIGEPINNRFMQLLMME
jgi:hypothetical protein